MISSLFYIPVPKPNHRTEHILLPFAMCEIVQFQNLKLGTYRPHGLLCAELIPSREFPYSASRGLPLLLVLRVQSHPFFIPFFIDSLFSCFSGACSALSAGLVILLCIISIQLQNYLRSILADLYLSLCAKLYSSKTNARICVLS